MKTPLETLRSITDELDSKLVSPKEPQFLLLTKKEIHNLEDDLIAKGFNTAITYDVPKSPEGIPYDNLKQLSKLTITVGNYYFVVIQHYANSGNYNWHQNNLDVAHQ